MDGRLEEIVRNRLREVDEAMLARPLEEVKEACAGMDPCRGFADAIRAESAAGRLALIAEAKRRSPSAGEIAAGDDTADRAATYESAGATCVSVLTESKHFGGSARDLGLARKACALPVLRKDFIADPWQVYESRAMGADCILLIVAALPHAKLSELAGLAMDIGLDVLVEVHEDQEVSVALDLGQVVHGVNNRDLRTFETDLSVAERIVPMLTGEDRLVVAESAIKDGRDARRMRVAGADAILVGEALMRSQDMSSLVSDMRGTKH